MKTYRWQLVRQKSAQGLNYMAGVIEAHSAVEARQAINREVAEYAAQGLMRGEYSLLMSCDGSRQSLAERTIYVHSTHPHPLTNQEVA